MTHANPVKVTITVEKGRYDKSVNNGAEYTDVSHNAHSYGQGSPCDTKEEVANAIKRQKENIIEQGDIPVVNNKLEARTIFNYTN